MSTTIKGFDFDRKVFLPYIVSNVALDNKIYQRATGSFEVRLHRMGDKLVRSEA